MDDQTSPANGTDQPTSADARIDGYGADDGEHQSLGCVRADELPVVGHGILTGQAERTANEVAGHVGAQMMYGYRIVLFEVTVLCIGAAIVFMGLT
jgi:hypothetical protein